MSGIIGGAGSKSGVIGEIGLGVSNVSTFHLGSHFTTSDVVITGWSAATSTSYNTGKVGRAVTESSGVFTLPSTGIWQISANFHSWHENSDSWTGAVLFQDSTYIAHTTNGYNVQEAEEDIRMSFKIQQIVNVTALSQTYKFHSMSIGGDGSYISGIDQWSAGWGITTNVIFIKLGNYIG